MLVVIHALIKACLANNILDSPEKYGCDGQKWVSTISSNVQIWQACKFLTLIYRRHICFKSGPMSGLKFISCRRPISALPKLVIVEA